MNSYKNFGLGDLWSDSMTSALAPNPTVTVTDPTASGVIPAPAPSTTVAVAVIAPVSNTKKYLMYGGGALAILGLLGAFGSKNVRYRY